MMVRVALALIVMLLAACTPPGNAIDSAADQREAARQQKNCADPKWKAEHLGIWYSVCRPNEALK